jgi:hypothetical protein
MTRSLLVALPLAALLAASVASAEGLVPGSDTGTRDAQAFQDNSVGSGRFADPAASAERSYGYPVTPRAAPTPSLRNDAARTDDARGPGEGTRRPAPAVGTLVPGSDSF